MAEIIKLVMMKVLVTITTIITLIIMTYRRNSIERKKTLLEQKTGQVTTHGTTFYYQMLKTPHENVKDCYQRKKIKNNGRPVETGGARGLQPPRFLFKFTFYQLTIIVKRKKVAKKNNKSLQIP